MSEKERKYLNYLNQKFNETNFIEFVIDLLNINSEEVRIEEINNIQDSYKQYINSYKKIAKYNIDLDNIGIFIIKLNDTTSTKARVLQRNYVASLLQKYNLDASLVAFYSDKENAWRISFVKKEVEFTDKGIKQSVSPARRYSYLVGENESTHTAQEFLFQLLKNNDKKYTIKEIEEKFDVEKVTKKFFEEYKDKYLKLKDFLDNNEDFQTEAKNCDFDSEEFAKKLMGQIVFLYFLQKKGWLGVQLIPNELSIDEYNDLLSENDIVSQNLIKQFYELQDSRYYIESTKFRLSEMEEDIINLTKIFSNTKYNMPWGSGDKSFIRTIYKQSRIAHKNFFDDYLEPFFYKGLNEHRDNQYFALFNCKIPFLNGGLFEPLNDYRWSSAHFNINNDLFSNDKKDGILDFLDLYNFTIDEEEPLEKDIAVDPEMLGKIFENLLDVNERASKGAFYTPREIVFYMCQESLANYLVNKVGVNYEEIIKFIKYGDLISQYDIEISDNGSTEFEIGKTLFDNIIELDDALINVKIADPAVGSGAFPLGMVTEIVKLRSNLQNYIIIKNELKQIDIDDYYNTEHLVSEIYQLKKNTIENCIYAVDIEPSAVDIAKLRLWLSLIVDYPNDKEPQPLPNLDCKIMQGNSLIDEFEGVPLFDEKNLNNNLKKYHRNESKLREVKGMNVQYSIFNQETLSKNLDLLFDLQQKYFVESDNSLKKQLKAKIEEIQMASVECSLQENFSKLNRFKEIAKKKQKPWFVWKVEFYDVFKNNGGFDVVIGNPPYVQLQKDSGKIGKIYKDANYEVYSPSSDIYCLFYEFSTHILRENGTLCFITSNKWMRASYGEKLRQFLAKKTNPRLLIDFAGNKVFDSATVDVNILMADKKNNNKNTRTCTICDSYKNNLYSYIQKNQSINSFVTNENWVILNEIEISIKNKIEKYGKKLSLWDISINRGILTGYNDVFVIDSITKNKLVQEDSNNSEFIKPILRGRDIKKNNCDFANLWLIMVPCGYTNNQSIGYTDKEQWFKDNYIVLYNYLTEKEKELSKTRGTKSKGLYNRDDKGDYWWELRSCKYMNDFNKQKIIYPCIMSNGSSFALDDEEKYYVIAPGNIIIGEKLDYLIKHLNSKTYYFALRKYYMGGGIEGELKTNRLLLLPIPIPNKNQNKIVTENDIQENIFLTKKEKDYINNYKF